MPAKTYQIGHRRRRSWRLLIVGLLAVILVGVVAYAYLQFRTDTQVVIKNSPGSTHPLVIPNAKTKHIDQGLFAFDVPADWKLIKHDTAAYSSYSYQSTLANADNRYLDIYIDKLPRTLAVNKAVKVQSQGSTLTHGEVSENCITYTTGSPRTAGGSQPLTVAAKWDGVDFLCDTDNTLRNVVGTSAPGTINQVILAGQTGGSHPLFFVYTDNNATPEYSIFYNILESFVVN